MERTVFNDCFLWLEKFHGKRDMISSESQDKYFSAFKDEHDEVFCEGVNISTEKLAPGQFPTIEKLRRFCTEAREKLQAKEKQNEPRHLPAPPPLGDIRNVPRGVEAIALVQKITLTGLTADVLAEIAELHSPAWDRIDWRAELAACAEIRANVARRGNQE